MSYVAWAMVGCASGMTMALLVASLVLLGVTLLRRVLERR